MATNRFDFLVLLFLISKLTIGIQANELDNNPIKNNTFYLRNLNLSSSISGIFSYNWTENRECLIELNAIKNGIKNDELWAINGNISFSLSIVNHLFSIN